MSYAILNILVFLMFHVKQKKGVNFSTPCTLTKTKLIKRNAIDKRHFRRMYIVRIPRKMLGYYLKSKL
jgi:hypothetical protein